MSQACIFPSKNLNSCLIMNTSPQKEYGIIKRPVHVLCKSVLFHFSDVLICDVSDILNTDFLNITDKQRKYLSN